MTEMPEPPQFQWRADCEWVNGTHSRTTVEKFFGARRRAVAPSALLGRHRPPGDVRFLRQRSDAARDGAHRSGRLPDRRCRLGRHNRGIQLRSVKATVEADMDLAGILGIDTEVRNGFAGIRVRYEIDADATKAEIEAIVAQSQKRSAVVRRRSPTRPTIVVEVV